MGRAEKIKLLGKPTEFIEVRAKEGLPKLPPVVFGPGLGETAENFEPLAKKTALLGFDSYVLSPQWGKKNKEFNASDKEKLREQTWAFYKDTMRRVAFDIIWDSLPLTEMPDVLAYIDFIEKKVNADRPGERVVGAGHSKSGVSVPMAAFVRPDLIGTVATLNAAGQSGPEKFTATSRMSRSFHWEAMINSGDWKVRKNAFWYILAHGMYLTRGTVMREAAALARFNSYPLLNALSKANPPVRVIRFSTKDDLIFPSGKVRAEEAREKERSHDHADFGKHVELEGGGHYNVVTKPEEIAQKLYEAVMEGVGEDAAKEDTETPLPQAAE